MSGQDAVRPVGAATRGDRAPERCGRPATPEAYRCACGRVRDLCVRDTVHTVWTAPGGDPAGG
ncbi:hypothetical protein ABT214_29040, partial [Micromonospora purpureochromogenes]|uniref:hypothetical protein n=1 Tax=Micromonospora purpureochromogenes TaxID=47872 RepID=UPI00332BFA1E